MSDFSTLWSTTCQASLSFAISRSLLKFMSIESVMLSNHLILCRPLLFASIFPNIRVFSNESAHCIRRAKNWSFSFRSVLPIQGWFPLGLIGLISLIRLIMRTIFLTQKRVFSFSYSQRWFPDSLLPLQCLSGLVLRVSTLNSLRVQVFISCQR